MPRSYALAANSLLLLAARSPTGDTEETRAGSPEVAAVNGTVSQPTVVRAALGAMGYTTFAAEPHFANLVNSLANAGPNTVFTPANTAFDTRPAGMSETDIARVNAAIMEQVNADGRAYLSHTKLNGKYTLRLAIGNIRTNRSHVETAWADLKSAAAAVAPLIP